MVSLGKGVLIILSINQKLNTMILTESESIGSYNIFHGVECNWCGDMGDIQGTGQTSVVGKSPEGGCQG